MSDDWTWAGGEPQGPAELAQEQAWIEHLAGEGEDAPLPAELPGGSVWQAIYDEASRDAGDDKRDLWNRISEDERARYATLAAITRRKIAAAGPEPPPRPNPLPFISARQLAAETPPVVPWTVWHLLARGALTEIDGQAKRAGKTTFLGHLFAAVLHGRDFLGWRTERTPIVLLTEMHDTPLRQLLERTALVEEDDLRILRWSDTRLVRWPDVVADAIAECREHGAGLFVTDTLPQFAGIRGDAENDAGAALAALEPLQAAAADGLAVAIVRHERKGGGVVGESGRGSTAFTGAVDIVVRLAQPLNPARETIRQLSVLSRFDGAPADLMIELTPSGYDVLGEEFAVVFGEARNDVKYILPNAPEGWAERDIAAALPHHSRTTIQRALDALMNAGEVVRGGTGRRGSPFVWSRPSLESSSGFVPNGAPLKGGSPPLGRNLAPAHSESVGDRMAELLEEPEDLDEPEGWSASEMFGPPPVGAA